MINESADKGGFALVPRLGFIDCVGQGLLEQVKVETDRVVIFLYAG